LKNNDLLSEKIENAIESEMTLVQLHKLISECSISEIICAIKKSIYQGRIIARKHRLERESYYFNSLELWSDKFRLQSS